MIIKGADFVSKDIDYDICIIGSGPAGLTLASELLDSGKKVCVLESGEEDKSQYASKLKSLISSGEIKIKNSSRERILGGTSTTWGGGSAPMDTIDFSYRDFMTYPSSWPINHSDLIEYYKKTEKYGFPKYEMFESDFIKDIRNSGDFVIDSKILNEKIFISIDPPWNFGIKLKNIFEGKNLDLYLDSTVVKIISNKLDGKVVANGVSVIRKDGSKHIFHAKYIIVACGGIESVRLLLASDDNIIGGLGNSKNQLGRYVMNHPKNNVGKIVLKKPVKNLPYYFGFLKNGVSGYSGIRIKESNQADSKILNSYLRFEPIFPWSDNEGVWSFLTIVKNFKKFINYWKKNQKKIVHLRDYNETPDDHKKNNTKNSFSWFRAFYSIFINAGMVSRYLYHRLNTKSDLYISEIRLRNYMEMEPVYENIITLSDELDINGNKIPKVEINTTELDKNSIISLHNTIASEFRNLGLGELKDGIFSKENWPEFIDASHHLGGARMGSDPNKSVVNSNLRLHDVENLYVCSGSVFPTSGCANPTYTICALSIRLADLLKKL